MIKELKQFVFENGLSPFNFVKTSVKKESNSIFRTRDAKCVYNKVISKLSLDFNFSDTSNLFYFFDFTSDAEKILKRQEFFRSFVSSDRTFLKKIKKPRAYWKPRYDIVAVTEDEQTFVKLNELGCTTQFLVSERDVLELERYDIVQIVNCENFRRTLERLPQAVLVDSVEDIYLERYLEQLSGWKETLEILNSSFIDGRMKELVNELSVPLKFLDGRKFSILSEEEVEKVIEEMNSTISVRLKELTISGESLVKILSEGKLPPEFKKIIDETISYCGLPQHIFNIGIPLTIDRKELDEQIRRQSANEFTNLAEEIKRHASLLKSIPSKLKELSALILIEDFIFGVVEYFNNANFYPVVDEKMEISGASNFFLDYAQPISFGLDSANRCSILTGANSGGKTTLLEHIIQMISLMQLGLPVKGNVKLPLFSEVYYFAKNKGSASKGAFETLLSQMSKIKPGDKTLILADEIEAVTEPGVAGEIISATASYFIRQNCFLIIATHLGHEIQKTLPERARIDGIEAKGLDENFDLIVDHNPVLGRLAHSTPELIVERMANAFDEDYFRFLNEFLKRKIG